MIDSYKDILSGKKASAWIDMLDAQKCEGPPGPSRGQ